MSHRSEISAGILAFRRKRGLELLLAHPGGPYWRNKDEGAWSIPKGVVESGDLLACAKREFNEETGLTADGTIVPLEPIRQKSGKTVHAFALEADFDLTGFVSNVFEMEWPPRSGKLQSFPEIDRIAYFKVATARQKILAAQWPFIDQLVARLAERINQPAHQRPVRLVALHDPGLLERGGAPLAPGRQRHHRIHIGARHWADFEAIAVQARRPPARTWRRPRRRRRTGNGRRPKRAAIGHMASMRATFAARLRRRPPYHRPPLSRAGAAAGSPMHFISNGEAHRAGGGIAGHIQRGISPPNTQDGERSQHTFAFQPAPPVNPTRLRRSEITVSRRQATFHGDSTAQRP